MFLFLFQIDFVLSYVLSYVLSHSFSFPHFSPLRTTTAAEVRAEDQAKINEFGRLNTQKGEYQLDLASKLLTITILLYYNYYY
jgi:hypothetical protein